MKYQPSESLAHAYDAEPCPILHDWPDLWWLPDWERAIVVDALARQYGGQGWIYRPNLDREFER